MSDTKKQDDNKSLAEEEKQDNMALAEAQIKALLDMAQMKADEIINNAVDKAAKIVEDARGQQPVNTGVKKRSVKEEPKVKVKLSVDKTKNNADLPVSINGVTYLCSAEYGLRFLWLSLKLLKIHSGRKNTQSSIPMGWQMHSRRS